MNRTLVCSDLHGMYDLWSQIKNFLDETDTLYILGDATDRGPNGWKILKEVLADPRVRYLKGNHDQMMLESWKDDWADTYLWFRNGGYTTFSQMELDDPDTVDLYLRELDRKAYHETYINKTGQKVLLSHAGYTPGRETDDRHQYIWDRDHIYDEADYENDAVVIHGHTPLKYLVSSDVRFNDQKTIGWYAGGHKIDIDNGCFVTNKIGLLDLDTWEDYTFETV